MVEKFLMDVVVALAILGVIFAICGIACKLGKSEELSLGSFLLFSAFMLIGYLFTSVLVIYLATFFMLLALVAVFISAGC